MYVGIWNVEREREKASSVETEYIEIELVFKYSNLYRLPVYEVTSLCTRGHDTRMWRLSINRKMMDVATSLKN